MTQRTPSIQFEDIRLEQARQMSRGPRMDPALYQALTQKIQSLGHTATRVILPEGMSLTTMKNRILRVAGELHVPVIIRRVPGGLLFWRSTKEDLVQAREVAQRPRVPQQQRAAPSRGRTLLLGNIIGITSQERPRVSPCWGMEVDDGGRSMGGIRVSVWPL